MSALHELLTQIVDYAGLFPPAGLDLKSVVENFDRYRQGKASWMLARVIIPAARLGEFIETADFCVGSTPWQVSALIPGVDAPDDGLQKAIDAIADFNAQDNGAIVDAVEVKCPAIEHVATIASLMSESIQAFLEIPHKTDPAAHIQAIKEAGNVFAKIRTGGVTPELIPPTNEVARFIHRCAEYNVGFKATAGLHHPIRNEFNLTYEADAPTGTMHGFLNVFVAASLAFSGAAENVIEEVLKSRNISDFVVSDNQIQFGDHIVVQSEIESLRKNKAISFGSCSFEEPVADLRELGFESEIQPAV